MALFTKFKKGVKHNEREAYLNSIIANLNNILNSRRGYGSFLPNFGIRDLNEYTNREQIAWAVIDEVKQCITDYEPRVEIKNIIIEHDHNPMQLAFTIECVVLYNERKMQMIFDTVFKNFQIIDK